MSRASFRLRITNPDESYRELPESFPRAHEIKAAIDAYNSACTQPATCIVVHGPRFEHVGSCGPLQVLASPHVEEGVAAMGRTEFFDPDSADYMSVDSALAPN